MLAYVVLHNMIVEDEREEATINIDLNDSARTSFVVPPKVNLVLICVLLSATYVYQRYHTCSPTTYSTEKGLSSAHFGICLEILIIISHGRILKSACFYSF